MKFSVISISWKGMALNICHSVGYFLRIFRWTLGVKSGRHEGGFFLTFLLTCCRGRIGWY
jgi:hypothetical protein